MKNSRSQRKHTTCPILMNCSKSKNTKCVKKIKFHIFRFWYTFSMLFRKEFSPQKIQETFVLQFVLGLPKESLVCLDHKDLTISKALTCKKQNKKTTCNLNKNGNFVKETDTSCYILLYENIKHTLIEPRHEKKRLLYMRKQRRRSASR